MDNMRKQILVRLCDFALDHLRIMGLICLVVPLVLLGLTRFFENTVIPKLLAVLIIAPLVVLIVAELSGKFARKQ